MKKSMMSLVGLLPCLLAADVHSLKSPDGRNELRLETGSVLTYSVWRDGAPRVAPTPISLTLSDRAFGPSAKVVSTERRRVGGKVPMPFWKKSVLDDTRDELLVTFEGGWRVCLAARNDAVGYRFETSLDGRVKVLDEAAGVTLPDGNLTCVFNRTNEKPALDDPFQVSWETQAETTNVLDIVAEAGKRHIYAPMLVKFPKGVMCVCESDLLDYPKRDFTKKSGETLFKSAFAAVPDPAKLEDTRRYIRVHGRLDHIAATDGTRTYPWRLFLLEDREIDLCASEAVTAFASPCRLKDTSWIKPGKVAWEWWNDWNISGVGFKSGSTSFRNVNMETYRHYIDFAAEHGLEYVIMDEGWSRDLDVLKIVPTIDMPTLVKYASDKNVGIVLWCSWPQLVARPREIFGHYAKMGVKGFKIDFMDRGDQFVVKYEEDIAALAAEYRLLVSYHGAFPPVGLSRTYPNVINYEGVFGLEQAKWCKPETDFPKADLGTFFVRMTAGPLDYTPGAMRNSTMYRPRPAPSGFRSDYQRPGSMGTRVHQMALMSLYEAPMQMLCDSPTQYRKNLECFRFMKDVPTVWDDTVPLAGDPARYALVARRKGETWYVSGIASWAGAKVDIDLSFLGSGEWQADVFTDGPNAEHDAEDYLHNSMLVRANDTFPVEMGPGGGFTMKLVPAAKQPMRAFFSTVLGETVLVGKYADGVGDFAWDNRRLRVRETADGSGRATFRFRADSPVGAYFRYYVPAGVKPVVRLNGVVRDGVMAGRMNWIWRRWTDGDVVEMDFTTHTEPAAPKATSRADWMRGKYGVMVHWLFPSNGDIDRWTDAFDVDAFLTDFEKTGADWLVFTAGQCRGAYCSPSAAFDGLCGKGHTPKRDLLAEIARGVKKLGKRFVVYSACDFVRDGCDDHAVQKGLCWDNANEDRAEFQKRWPRVLKEWSLRLGKNCDGWWLDGLGTQYPHGVDFAAWADACRAGNPDSALAFNGGSNDFSSYGPSDYAAGETSSLKWALPDLAGKDPIDAVRHYLFPIDGYWGGFWAWPRDEWAGVTHLLKTRPELFDQQALDARLTCRDFVEPIYTATELKRFLDGLKKVNGAATINVGISPEGRLNPHSIELLRTIR